MTNAIVTLDQKAVAEYTASDVALCKHFIKAEKATEQEWQKLVLLATKYHLNPLCNEIWILPGVGVTVGIAGMVKIAERSGNYDGMSTETSTDENGDLIHTCTVWRKDMSHPVTKSIRNKEFAKPGTNGKLTNWDKMPIYMGEKVAEVHALKRAFSLMDLYIPEEFGLDDDRSDAEPYQGSIDGKPVTVEPMPKIMNCHSSIKETTVTPPNGITKCSMCGKHEPMIDFERQKVQMGFVNANIQYDVPKDICYDCACKIYKEKLNEQK